MNIFVKTTVEQVLHHEGQKFLPGEIPAGRRLQTLELGFQVQCSLWASDPRAQFPHTYTLEHLSMGKSALAKNSVFSSMQLGGVFLGCTQK